MDDGDGVEDDEASPSDSTSYWCLQVDGVPQ
jgi:hypothetical protein